MADCVKETLCTRCVHRGVCRYTEDYLEVLKAVESITVDKKCSDGKKCLLTPIHSLEFIAGISVNCKFHQHRINEYCHADNAPLD